MNIKKHIPNSLTLLNLFSGCMAIVFIFQGHIDWVIYCVGISLLADLLDGMVARALKVSSPIGKELDSLADMVSFGVLPSMILFYLIEEQLNVGFRGCFGVDPLIFYGKYAAFLLACFSALRLAKFNVDDSQSSEFKGLATPASTAFVVGILALYLDYGFLFSTLALFSKILLLSLLLVSDIPMFSFKMKSFAWKDAKWQYVFIILAIIVLVLFKFAGIALAVLFYVLLNLIRYFINKYS